MIDRGWFVKYACKSTKPGLDHLPRTLPYGKLLSGPGEEETCNYLNERKWEEYSLECHLTGFPELGVISRHTELGFESSL